MQDLICYVFDGWHPLLRPAPQERDWMDKTNDTYAYRCLPLSIANTHGWQLLCYCDFEVWWTGGPKLDDLRIRILTPDVPLGLQPSSVFGHGILTFHVHGIFRTPPGYNLYVTGTPNEVKEGIMPLTGIVETDWAPFTFTMNWRLLRQNHVVRFRQGEPFCFFFPLKRSDILDFNPVIRPIADDPDLVDQYKRWEASRNAFRAKQQVSPSPHKTDTWQKDYFKGQDMNGAKQPDHINKLRLPNFIQQGGG